MVLLVTVTTAGFEISIVRESSENYIHATPYCGARLSPNVGLEGEAGTVSLAFPYTGITAGRENSVFSGIFVLRDQGLNPWVIPALKHDLGSFLCVLDDLTG